MGLTTSVMLSCVPAAAKFRCADLACVTHVYMSHHATGSWLNLITYACAVWPPLCRLAILYHDWLGVKKLLARAKVICEAGGDWEHKNKLKVRHAVTLKAAYHWQWPMFWLGRSLSHLRLQSWLHGNCCLKLR